MACPINLADPNGELWAVSISDLGILSLTDTLTKGAGAITLTDLGKQNVYVIAADTFGRFTYTLLGPVNQNPGFVTVQNLVSPNFLWSLCVGFNQDNQAILMSTQVGPAPPPDPVVGQIYFDDYIKPHILPTPQQPGGPGTPVTMPLQQVGELIGFWFPGCGHSVNHWDVIPSTVCQQPVALLRCPLCGYVQQIISPYSAIYSDSNYILVA